MHPDTATWRAHHAGAGRLCARAGGGPSPAGTDPLTEEPAGFEHLRAAGAIFGSLLGLVLLNYAWVFHTQDDSTMADFVFGTLFASLVIVWAWRERAWLAPLCRWPEFDRTGILVMLTTPQLTLAAVRGQTYVADWIHLPVVNYLKGFERDGYGVGTALVFVAVLPAIFEEIAFRETMRDIRARRSARLARDFGRHGVSFADPDDGARRAREIEAADVRVVA